MSTVALDETSVGRRTSFRASCGIRGWCCWHSGRAGCGRGHPSTAYAHTCQLPIARKSGAGASLRTNSDPEKERAEAIWRSPSSLAMQSARPSLSMMATLEKAWPKLTPSSPGAFWTGSLGAGVEAPEGALDGALDATLDGALLDLAEPFWFRLGGMVSCALGYASARCLETSRTRLLFR